MRSKKSVENTAPAPDPALEPPVRRKVGRPKKMPVSESALTAALEMKTRPLEKRRFYTLADVSRLLRISSRTADKWIKQGRFKGVEWGGNTWIFRKDFKILENKNDPSRTEYIKRLIPAE